MTKVQEKQLNARPNNPTNIACFSPLVKEYRIEILNVSQIIMDLTIHLILSCAKQT